MSALHLKHRHVVLLLQGGGALGAFQVGAYKALAERCADDDAQIEWVAGISIGAINAAVIAGHKSRAAITDLEALWADILSPPTPPFDYTALLQFLLPWPSRQRTLETKYLDWMASAFPFGQRNFFSSRVLNPLLNPWFAEWYRSLGPNELSFYDTGPMRTTLNKYVDWSRLKRGCTPRLCLGAARVADGEVDMFDSNEMDLTIDHVMASCALPPAFPPVQIGGKGPWYFDGGISNNTPIELLRGKICSAAAADHGQEPLVIVLDLWDRKNKHDLETLEDVNWRVKSIQYGSRKTAAERVVRELAARPHGKSRGHVDVVQVMLETRERDGAFSFRDADFSHLSFETLHRQGYEDMHHALDKAERVRKVSGHDAALYRYGRWHKHHPTDLQIH